MFGLVIDPGLTIHPVSEKPDAAESGAGLAQGLCVVSPVQNVLHR
jgi:hypothetical protein